MTRSSSNAIAAGLALLAFLPGSCTKRLPHGGPDPVWPLRGLHAAVPCAGCHGDGVYEEQTTSCLECHDADRPDPSHNPGQECYLCHTEDGWAVGVYGTGETGLPPTDSGTEPEPTTVSGHPLFPEDQLCWDCHEKERKDPAHYTDPDPLLWSDCGPCHGLVDWAEPVLVHPARTPHGTYSLGVPTAEADWVVTCTSCHPVSLELFTCTQGCHDEPGFFPHFGAKKPGPAADEGCMDCHDQAAL